MDFWEIMYTFILPALAGGILGPIYARWFRWWRRSRKHSEPGSECSRGLLYRDGIHSDEFLNE